MASQPAAEDDNECESSSTSTRLRETSSHDFLYCTPLFPDQRGYEPLKDFALSRDSPSTRRGVKRCGHDQQLSDGDLRLRVWLCFAGSGLHTPSL